MRQSALANFHDNRGTAATLLAEAGAEIAEALCWSVDKAQKVIDLYLARRGVLAANAIAKLEQFRDRKRLHHRSRSQAATAGGEYDLRLRFCGFYGVMRRSDGCLVRCV